MLLTPITPTRADSEHIGLPANKLKMLLLHNERNNKVSVQYVLILNEFSAASDKNNISMSRLLIILQVQADEDLK